ncbi:UTP--glucose-1-phosphate uridylyltransferase GalU [Cobetia marina]|jgi:UTP--glucose-1-phosphate uridylyltransferase|uniref:UTP--glucose-1-phosphate uridylyltransferase n=1 Tax=Cobetia marina TaxID=28258 RepID=A0ABU9GAK9_COBMA|nr:MULTISPECIES: UTP--glucose-1-phosphate uridylyltransferase GalU [Cobetia]AOM01432.1 UTP--glucose-1-phosphate uridylyltransferase [Cobetia marina]AZV31351.1 UTP--glucose-1-phosphate uridylyltransferase [Cobetia sp. ICG0124]MDA5563437.1 UTP--glucose-1-phosphate uridylyltransferase GalU [Cobetia sp. MMG027]MDH2289696.1 UTP--glucose-1-phosphate uridylyltransferase GalU [Cobetia sp. 10Alg 146]MDH2373756.1 UTP--glucose-1-phosphate uridylyltransferase GalU [Cobetia sp. 3AK]
MIRKAVLPVAGLGTRCLPASKAIPKEMITIVDKPVIQYVVEEAVAAGIKEIVLVTHSSKNAIENHFDKHFELETTLEAKGKFELLEELRHIIPDDVKIISVRQPEPLGLGHAVLCAKPIVGDEPFLVMLPDVLVDGEGLEKNDLARMMEAYEATNAAQIMVENVPQEMAYKYGIVAIDGETPEAGKSAMISGMVEKPAPGTEPSTLAVIGRYLLPGRIFELLENTPPGAGGEIQLTDAIDTLRDDKAVAAYRMAGDTYDCGHQLGYLEATISFAKRHPKFGEGFRELMTRYQEK